MFDMQGQAKTGLEGLDDVGGISALVGKGHDLLKAEDA